jgi:hypothetical protein
MVDEVQATCAPLQTILVKYAKDRR